MKRIIALYAVYLMLVFVGVGATSAQEADQSCNPVGGTFLINFIDQTNALATLTGDLRGAVRGTILEMTSDDDGVLSLTLEHVATTEYGAVLMTSDEATLIPVEENVFYMRQTQTIVGGTGKFANATGTLTDFGAVNMATGQGVLRYSGEICSGA